MPDETITLTPGEVDVRLGRRYEPDPRNKDWPIRALLPLRSYEQPRTKIWACKTVLDQGNIGSCVGNAFAAQLIARPYPIKNITQKDAVNIYRSAQTLDEYPGEDYEGTSVLAGVKATKKLYPNTIESYRFGSTLADAVAVLSWHSPIVVGFNFYSGMYTVDSDGFIHVTGSQVGGHAMLARGVDIQKNAIMIRNSWGRKFGRNGDAWISYDDFSRLIQENGELCIPITMGWWRQK